MSYAQSIITSPAPGSVLPGSRVDFHVSMQEFAVNYQIAVGSSLGATDIFGAGIGDIPPAIVTISNIPVDGRTIYVRLTTHIMISQGAGGGYANSYPTADFTFLAAGGSDQPPPAPPPTPPAATDAPVNASEINVDGTLQFAATQFEVAVNGSIGFETGFGASPTIRTGQLDPTLTPFINTIVTNGYVDEVELHVAPNKMTSVYRGRDLASLAVDNGVWVIYAVRPPAGTTLPTTAPIPGFPPLPIVPGVTVPAPKTGVWKASTIAKDLCSRVGLNVSWGCPDYTLREDLSVNGSVLAALQQLVEPFNHFEPTKIDMYFSGGIDRGLPILNVVQRPAGNGGSVLLDAHDARITNLMIRRRQIGYIRVLRIVTNAMNKIVAGTVSVTGEHDEHTVDEASDAAHGVVSRLTTDTTYRDVDNAIMRQTTEVEQWDDSTDPPALRKTSFSTLTNDWPSLPILTAPDGTISVPFVPPLAGTVVNTDEFDSEGAVTTTSTVTDYDYEDSGGSTPSGYLRTATTVKTITDVDGTQHVSSEIKTYKKDGLRMYVIASITSDGEVRRTSANGTPPGGPGRGKVLVPASSGAMTPTVYAMMVSGQGKDVTITNNNLLLPELKIIAGQATLASGAIETEVSFTAANIPWIERGGQLLLSGIEDEFGAPLVIGSASGSFSGLITEAKFEYREDSENPTCLIHVRASTWS